MLSRQVSVDLETGFSQYFPELDEALIAFHGARYEVFRAIW